MQVYIYSINSNYIRTHTTHRVHMLYLPRQAQASLRLLLFEIGLATSFTDIYNFKGYSYYPINPLRC